MLGNEAHHHVDDLPNAVLLYAHEQRGHGLTS